MTDTNPLPDELREVESALRGLAPLPPRVDQARLMFRAGQESVRGRLGGWSRQVWPLTTALMTALALVLAVNRPRPATIIVYRPAASAPADRPATTVHDGAPDSGPAETPDGPAAPATAPPWESSAPVSPAQTLAGQLPGWLGQRQLALTRGVDALPVAAADGGIRPPVSQRELLKEYLGASGTAPPAESTTGVWPFFPRGVP